MAAPPSDDYPLVHLTSRAQLREWLAQHHATSRGIWLMSWRSRVPGERISYEDMIAECLCFGWIDSTVRTLDDQRNAIRLTPRKPGSGWARTNKARLETLLRDGLVEPAGLAAIELAKADGSWTLLDDVENLEVPADLAAALAAAGARAAFDGLTPGRRKQSLAWIKQAKREATRRTRIDKVVAAAGQGRSIVD